MRLLNVEDLTFKAFDDEKDRPTYAIASHRWERGETTYQGFLDKADTTGPGHEKVIAFCDFVKRRNQELQLSLRLRDRSKWRPIQWLWIDTCCIDQRHSAEVAENITSMYEYYGNAEECYVFLSDVKLQNVEDEDEDEQSGQDTETCRQKFMNSKWFTRGWTLQELVAPSKVIFLSRDWELLGHKCNYTPQTDPNCLCTLSGQRLNKLVVTITGIPAKVLNKQQNPRSMVPGDVCKWIRMRRTTKVEDLAYCLLGLLGVYMLPHYGEKTNAWVRLEEEVLKQLRRDFGRPPVQVELEMSRVSASAFSYAQTEAESHPEQGQYISHLMDRHQHWVQTQRAAELSLRQIQGYDSLPLAARSKEMDDESRAALARSQRLQLMSSPAEEQTRSLPDGMDMTSMFSPEVVGQELHGHAVEAFTYFAEASDSRPSIGGELNDEDERCGKSAKDIMDARHISAVLMSDFCNTDSAPWQQIPASRMLDINCEPPVNRRMTESEEERLRRQRREEERKTRHGGGGGGGSGGSGGGVGPKKRDDGGPDSGRGPPPGSASSAQGSSSSSGRFDVPRSKLTVCCY